MDKNKRNQPEKIFDQNLRKQNWDKSNYVENEFNSFEDEKEDQHLKSNNVISKTVHAIPADEQQLENYSRVPQI